MARPVVGIAIGILIGVFFGHFLTSSLRLQQTASDNKDVKPRWATFQHKHLSDPEVVRHSTESPIVSAVKQALTPIPPRTATPNPPPPHVEREHDRGAEDASLSSKPDAAVGDHQDEATPEATHLDEGEFVDTLPPHFLSDPSDSSSLLKRRVHNNTIILIPVNFGYMEFGVNLACAMRRLHIHNYIFVAMDDKALKYLQQRNLPVYKDPDVPFVSSKSAAWADPHFHKLVCTKLIATINLLKQGVNVLLSDADIVFKRNPLEYVRHDLDLTWSIGSCHKSLKDNFNFATGDGVAKLNTGFYFAHAKPSVMSLLSRANENCKNAQLTGDQPAINSVMHDDISGGFRDSKQKGRYTYGFFDGCLFANGCVFFKHLCKGSPKEDPVLVHANFLVGKKDKIKHLKQYDLWDDKCIEAVLGPADSRK